MSCFLVFVVIAFVAVVVASVDVVIRSNSVVVAVGHVAPAFATWIGYCGHVFDRVAPDIVDDVDVVVHV